MTRWSGLLIVVALVALIGLIRVREHALAERLLARERTAVERIARLHARSQLEVQRGQKHPGLRGEFLAGEDGLRALPEISAEEISYAADDIFVYGLATRPWRDEATGVLHQGYVLRAWPLEYGVTGDREFQITDDGTFWQGQNRIGRSGLSYGFPPLFPDPEIGLPGAAWWPQELPDHK